MLLAWGTDLLWTGDAWSNARAKNHARGTHVRDPYQLRINGTRFVRLSTIGRRIVSFDFHRQAEVLPGLELADLVVSPLGRLVVGMPDRPDTEIVLSKLRTGPGGGWERAGLVAVPKEKGRGPLRSTRPRSV